jgi:hypothetical protein
MITVTPAAAGAQSRRNELAAEQRHTINFGDIPDAINDLLQEGVAAYRRDKKRADELLALAAAPTASIASSGQHPECSR